MTWQFTLTGLLIGGLVGLTGMGGGSLLTPILVIVFGFKPTYAVGTDILHGAIFKSFGAVRHRRLGTVHARLTFWMFLGSGPMSLLGVSLATWLRHHYGDGVQSVEAYAVGAALILGGLGLVAKTLVKVGVQPDDAPFLLTRRDRETAGASSAASRRTSRCLNELTSKLAALWRGSCRSCSSSRCSAARRRLSPSPSG